MVSRVGSFTFTSQNTQRLLSAQQKMIELQTQVATGKRSQDYLKIANNSRQLINLENAVDNAQQYVGQDARPDL